jgi:hypothetical protein
MDVVGVAAEAVDMVAAADQVVVVGIYHEAPQQFLKGTRQK